MLFFSILYSSSSCKSGTEKVQIGDTRSDRKVAKVFDRDIYLSELKPYASMDSAFLASEYIDKVAKQEAIINKVKEKGLNLDEIEMKTAQFRKSLIVLAYQKDYFKNNVDTVFSIEELKNYYTQNPHSFSLAEDIFKGYFIKIPLNTPKIEKLKELMRSKKPGDSQEVKSFCLRYANLFVLSRDFWSAFPKNTETIKYIKPENIPHYIQSGQVIYYEKEDHLYLVHLVDYKRARQQSPFDFCIQEIKMLLLNKRKMKAWAKFNEQVLDEAKSNKKIEIFQ